MEAVKLIALETEVLLVRSKKKNPVSLWDRIPIDPVPKGAPMLEIQTKLPISVSYDGGFGNNSCFPHGPVTSPTFSEMTLNSPQ